MLAGQHTRCRNCEFSSTRKVGRVILSYLANVLTIVLAIASTENVIARLEKDVKHLKAESDRWKSEAEKTVATLMSTRNDLMGLERRHHALELEKASWEVTLREGAHRSGEDRGVLQVRDDIELEHAQRTIDQLRQDLEDARMQATVSRDVIAKNGEEGAALRESIRQRDHELTMLREQVEAQIVAARKVEAAHRSSVEQLEAERKTRERVEQELDATRKQLVDAQSDLEAYVGAIKTVRSTTGRDRGGPVVQPAVHGTYTAANPVGGYFEETESTIDTAEPFLLSSPARRVNHHGGHSAQAEERGSPKLAMPVGRLERAAVEAISAVVIEELEREGRVGSCWLSIAKEAATRASLRLVYSATRLLREKGLSDTAYVDGISPLEALGDKRVLAEMVAQAQASGRAGVSCGLSRLCIVCASGRTVCDSRC